MRRNLPLLQALLLAATLLVVACGESPRGGSGPAQEPQLLDSVSPRYGSTVHQGGTIRIFYTLHRKALPDSVVLTIQGKRIGLIDTAGYPYTLRDNAPTGRLLYTLMAYQDSAAQSCLGEVTVLAKHPPVLYAHRVKKTYPHDRGAYTQGLVYENGYFFESTGLLEASTLRKVELATGKVVQKKNLPPTFFGEGLALLGGRLYQLTWQNNKALVYDLKTFELQKEFTYNGEGWGLASDGRLLYMSDGTERIRVLNPETFQPVRTLEVYTDRSKIGYINEMEWIDGELWANIYTTDNIVRINPKTGEVTGVIDMAGLLAADNLTPDTDVLNGIAFDSQKKRIYVTGKNWSQLFEIEVFKKP